MRLENYRQGCEGIFARRCSLCRVWNATQCLTTILLHEIPSNNPNFKEKSNKVRGNK
jgi:hypothetical protein